MKISRLNQRQKITVSPNQLLGFTLLELMIVIAVIAIIATLAAPAYTKMIQRSEVSRTARSFESALKLAKNEARVSGRDITVCPVADITTAQPRCSANWNAFSTAATATQTNGWIVFRDTNDNKRVDADEKVIDKGTFDGSKTLMTWSESGNSILIRPSYTKGTAGTMKVYTGGTDNANEVEVKLSQLGLVSLSH